MAERNDNFWYGREKKLRELEVKWFKENNGDKCPDYSMNGDLDGGLEKVVGNRVLLTGPLLDHVLWDIGMGMYEKLRRGHLTHLAPPL